MNNLALKLIVAAQNGFARLRDEEEAQTLTEYALIIAVIAIGVLVALYFLRDQIKNLFNKAGSSVTGLDQRQRRARSVATRFGPPLPPPRQRAARDASGEPLQGLLRIDEIAGKTPERVLAAIQNAYYTDSTLSSRGERVRHKRFGRSDGQTLVEFALVLPIFLLIVMGVFEFGRAITYWHDLNNTAQVAARYAVVNRYPGCNTTDVPWCTGYLAWAKSDLNSGGLKSDPSTTVTICYRDDDGSHTATAGDP